MGNKNIRYEIKYLLPLYIIAGVLLFFFLYNLEGGLASKIHLQSILAIAISALGIVTYAYFTFVKRIKSGKLLVIIALVVSSVMIIVNISMFNTANNRNTGWELKVKKTPYLLENAITSPDEWSNDLGRALIFSGIYLKDKILYSYGREIIPNERYGVFSLPLKVVRIQKKYSITEEQRNELLKNQFVKFKQRNSKNEIYFIMDDSWENSEEIYVLYEGDNRNFYVTAESFRKLKL